MSWAPEVSLAELGDGGLFVDGDWVESKDQDPHGRVRLTQLADVGIAEFRDRSDRWMRTDQAEALRCTYLAPGDILIARMPDPIGRACLVPSSIGAAVTAVDVAILRIRHPNVDPRYAMWAINAPAFHGRVVALQSGTTRKRISRKNLASLTIPLPSINQQRRIVEILEDHLSRLDAADTYLSAGLRRATRWHASVVSRAVWPDQYPRAEVGTLLREPMRNGRSDRAAKDDESSTRTLTLTAVTKNAFVDENTKQTITTAERARSLWLEPGDVLVQRSNTPELVGTAARYEGPRDWAIFPDLLIRLRTDESKIDSRFLVAALRSEEGHRQLRMRAKGLAGSMPKIDQAAIATAVVPLPDRREQQHIIEQLEDAERALELLRAEFVRARRRGAALRRALLAAAFSGRLTGQAPDVDHLEEGAG